MLTFDVLDLISKNRIEIMENCQNCVIPKTERFLVIDADVNTKLRINKEVKNLQNMAVT